MDVDSIRGFGMRGPYTHEKINQEAFKLFSKRTGFEVRIDCAEMINQYNFQADVFYPNKPEYHCDNSEFYRCSALLENLKTSGIKDPNLVTTLRKIGLASHIVQDFYAHSNWVEITRTSYAMAPIENLKEFFILAPNLQSGWHPFSPEGTPEDSVECYLKPQDEWGQWILGATHGCMEKDSNFSLRGFTIAESPVAFGRTFHELAGELAIEHTAKLLQYFYDKRSPQFMSCMVPSFRTVGCNQVVLNGLRSF
jgi:hypothetical protein